MIYSSSWVNHDGERAGHLSTCRPSWWTATNKSGMPGRPYDHPVFSETVPALIEPVIDAPEQPAVRLAGAVIEISPQTKRLVDHIKARNRVPNVGRRAGTCPGIPPLASPVLKALRRPVKTNRPASVIWRPLMSRTGSPGVVAITLRIGRLQSRPEIST